MVLLLQTYKKSVCCALKHNDDDHHRSLRRKRRVPPALERVPVMASTNNTDLADMRRALFELKGAYEDMKAEYAVLSKRVSDLEEMAACQPGAKRPREQCTASRDPLSKMKKSFVSAMTEFIDNNLVFKTIRRMDTDLADIRGIEYNRRNVDGNGEAIIQSKLHPKMHVAPTSISDKFMRQSTKTSVRPNAKYEQLDLRYCLDVVINLCTERGAKFAKYLNVTIEGCVDTPNSPHYARNVLSGVTWNTLKAIPCFEKFTGIEYDSDSD